MFERRSISYFRNCDVRNRSFVIFADLKIDFISMPINKQMTK